MTHTDHMELNDHELHKCKLCGQAFLDLVTLLCHEKTHPKNKPYKCSTCEKSFSMAPALICHTRIHTGERPYKCDVCKKTFVQSGHLQRHKRVHTGIKPYVCDICQNAYVDLSALIRHKRTHSGEKPYHCDICNKSFTQSSNFVFHKRIHTGERPYLCDVCGKTFVRSCDLLCHKRTHTGEKPYTCETCNKSFSKSSSLVDHKRVHTGLKPYKCDTCGKSFATSSHLVTHKRIHTGEKPYKCDICQKQFTTSSALVCHKRIHTGHKPYKCDLCEKRFCQLSHVWSHKRRNHGVEPHKCDICGESFTVSSHLLKHKQTHFQESPLLCQICGKTFPDSGALACHKQSHKEEELKIDDTFMKFASSSEASDVNAEAVLITEFEENACQNRKRDQDSSTPSMMEQEIHKKEPSCFKPSLPDPEQPPYNVKSAEYTGKPCACPQCHSSFPSKLQLKNHVCNKTLNSMSPLEQKISELVQKNSPKLKSALDEQSALQGTAIQTAGNNSSGHFQGNVETYNDCKKDIFWKSATLCDENQNQKNNKLEASQECCDTTFVCSQCSLCFHSINLLEKHQCVKRNLCKKECDNSNMFIQCVLSKDISSMERLVSDVNLTCVCSQCGCYFHSLSLLDEHLLNSHEFR